MKLTEGRRCVGRFDDAVANGPYEVTPATGVNMTYMATFPWATTSLSPNDRPLPKIRTGAIRVRGSLDDVPEEGKRMAT